MGNGRWGGRATGKSGGRDQNYLKQNPVFSSGGSHWADGPQGTKKFATHEEATKYASSGPGKTNIESLAPERLKKANPYAGKSRGGF